MARKKKLKNMKLEQDELKPVVIGRFESRSKSSIGTFFILTLFILMVVFLPEISEFIDGYLNPSAPIIEPSDPKEPSEPKPIPGDSPDVMFYPYKEDLKIINDEIVVDTIEIDTTNNTLAYNVTNNTSVTQNLEELNYYLEIYDSNQTLLERVKLADDTVLYGKAFKNYVKNVKTDTLTQVGYIVVIKKNLIDYPVVTLANDEEGVGSLVCTNTLEKVTYKFKDNLLKEVTSLVTVENTEVNYQTMYQDLNSKYITYSSDTGVNSTWIDHASGFSITTIVNLNEASREYIFNADTFKLDTEPKVVKFEMEAQGFICK